MRGAPLLAEVLGHLLPRHRDGGGVLDGRGPLDLGVVVLVHRVLHELAQDPAQRLARARLRDHPLPLDDAPEGRDPADLPLHALLDLARELCVGDRR